MVITRSKSVGLLFEKAVRLRRKLKALGLFPGTLSSVILFGASRPRRMTRQTVWEKYINPTSILFTRLVDGVEYIIAAGCIHALDARCPSCDVDDDADVKDNDVFARTRRWKVCKLWNTDKFVLGEAELNDGQ